MRRADPGFLFSQGPGFPFYLALPMKKVKGANTAVLNDRDPE